MEKLKMQTADGTMQNIERIAQLFPNCVTEVMKDGKETLAIDFDRLRQELSDHVVEGNDERYQFTWPDKRKAQLAANAPINATLRPCREESVDFDTTGNLYIEGDNLDVLKCLKETYSGKIKMIYIDPPYNTGNDFVYNDDFAESASEYLVNSGQYDDQGNRLVTNTESNGRYHTDWLNMIYPRLKVARDLLTDDGVIFISIDDNEARNLKIVLDEVFGESNFVAQMIWQQGKKSSGNLMCVNHEYLLVYAKSRAYIDNVEHSWTKRKDGLDKIYDKYDELVRIYHNDTESIQREIRKFYNSLPENDPAYASKHYNFVDERGLFFADNSCAPDRPETRCHKPLIHPITGKPTAVPSLGWRWKEATLDKMVEEGLIYYGSDETVVPKVKKYLKDMEYEIPSTVFYKDGRGASNRLLSLFDGKKIFDFPKDELVISSLVNYISSKDKNSIILDFFSGSATTAHSVMLLNAEDDGNRRFIMVQLPELTDSKSQASKAGYQNICEIGKERIRRAGKKIKAENPNVTALDTGFRVLKLADSNMLDVYYSPADVVQQDLFAQADNIKSDRTPEDLLFQVMLELGVLLDSKIEVQQVAGKQIFNVADGFLIACFDKGVTDEVITAIAKQHPQYAVLRDSSYADDSTATNFEQLFKTYSPSTTIKTL